MALELPRSIEWEILVVDNNSSDQTRQVVEQYMQRCPGRYRYLFEPKQGKSHALNSAIREARGELLAFMDDDVIVEPTWLQNLTSGLHSGEWAGAGGRILPDWMSAVPHWLPIAGSYAAGPLVLFDQGPVAKRLMEPPFGTNMAFQRCVLKNTAVSAPIWGHARALKSAMRTRRLAAKYWPAEENYATNHPPLSFMRFPRIA